MKNSSDKRFQGLCEKALDAKLGDHALLRIQTALNEELKRIDSIDASRPVMTISELADYLRVTEVTIEGYLGEVPCFELGGKLLFRREAVDKWLEAREMNYANEVVKFNVQKSIKFTVA